MAQHGRHLTDTERLRLYEALAADGAPTASMVASELGVTKFTAYKARRDLMSAGLPVLRAQIKGGEQKPQDRHDEAFWRRKAKAAERRVEELESAVRSLGALDGLTVRAPEWTWRATTGGRGRCTLIVHNSDRHYGEVIEPDEINGWNSFNPEVCARRVQRFMDAACELGRRWTDDADVDGVLYTMGGDEISGDIHDELRETNALTSLEQMEGAAGLHVVCIRQLVEEYGRIHVMAVPGNHGRTTRKPTAKKYGALSYDIAIARQVAREFADDDRVSFDIAAGADLTRVVYNRPILLTHGDKIGTGGGKGFAGPVLPIIRGGKQVELQYGRAGVAPHLILMGHYHTSAAPPGILANGSVPGLSEFGFGLRGHIETPRQWLAVLRQKWGLSERLDVQLEEPPAPPKPRVRLPAKA